MFGSIDRQMSAGKQAQDGVNFGFRCMLDRNESFQQKPLRRVEVQAANVVLTFLVQAVSNKYVEVLAHNKMSQTEPMRTTTKRTVNVILETARVSFGGEHEANNLKDSEFVFGMLDLVTNDLPCKNSLHAQLPDAMIVLFS